MYVGNRHLPFSYDNATSLWVRDTHHVGDPTFGERDFITTTTVTNRKQQLSGRG